MKQIWLLLAFLWLSVSAQANELPTSTTPEWVKTQTFEVATQRRDRVDGSVYMLVSNQNNYLLPKPTFYSRYVTQAVNAEGVESNSQITIDFDPSYQEVVFHDITVWRDGKASDRMATTEVKRFKREEELEKLLYSGQETYYLVINDVKAGDVIDYSYSIAGLNPVFNGYVDNWIKLGWSVPVLKTYARILTPENQSFNVSRYGDSEHFESRVEKHDGYTEYEFFDGRRAYSYLNEPDQPQWFIEYPYLNISNYQSWQEVVDWALPYYVIDSQGEQFNQAINELKKETDTKQQIVAAIKLAQESIRYLGMENGIGSHAPRQPEQILQQGYGDCKDKTLLLTALLRAIVVEAHPALVSTAFRDHLMEQPSGHSAFNHVIVTFEFAGKQFWVDPTQTGLSDSLATLTQSELGYGLIIKPGQTKPTKINTTNVNEVVTSSTFDVKPHKDGTATLFVETTYKGKQADRMRRYLTANSIEQVMDEFEGYYNKHYDGISASERFGYTDDREKNELQMTESYGIEKMWYLNEEDDEQFEVYADVIDSTIYLSEQKRRETPFYIGRPVKVVQTLVIDLPSEWTIEGDDINVSNEVFDFSLKVSGENDGWLSKLSKTYRKAQIEYVFNRKKTDVMPDGLKAYNKQLEKASENVVYQFTSYE